MARQTIAAHHIRELTGQQALGQVVLTPCAHCGKSMTRTELAEHEPACPGPSTPRGITIDSPQAGGTRGHDGMEDA